MFHSDDRLLLEFSFQGEAFLKSTELHTIDLGLCGMNCYAKKVAGMEVLRKQSEDNCGKRCLRLLESLSVAAGKEQYAAIFLGKRLRFLPVTTCLQM